MIHEIVLKQVSGSADCRGNRQTCCQAVLDAFPPVSCRIESGKVYGLISDFGCGSWALANCLGGRGETNRGGQAYRNGEPVNLHALAADSAFLPEPVIAGVNTPDRLGTARSCIETALACSGMPYTAEQLRQIFSLSTARFDRPLQETSGEIWLISLAIQFALGKDLFCLPWLSARTIFRAKVMAELGILDTLRKAGKIVLLPTNQKATARRICDRLILLS